MKAEIVAIGSELLRLGRRDTNGDWLTRRLNTLGVEVSMRIQVEDSIDAIAAQIRTCLPRAGIVIATGGLGPTDDDRTREAIARALGRDLERDPLIVAGLEDWFRRYNRKIQPHQFRQADRPRGAEWIDNPLGSAPGFLIDHEGVLVIALPGVPAEMKSMFDGAISSRLRAGSAGSSIAATSLRIGGRPESWVETEVGDLYGVNEVDVTILSGSEGVELHLRGRGATYEIARRRVADVERQMRERLVGHVYGTADDPLSLVVGRSLERAGATVATAESCTAGLLAAALTEPPGSTAWFRGGWVVYSNDLKTDWAGVPESMLVEHGAVSEPVARQLAEAARNACRATYGIGITGIAGPGGGSEEKPVGTVHLALAGPAGTEHHSLRMLGDRDQVRQRTVVFALDTLRRHLD